MVELYERVEQRGATDEHIWKWCENIESHVIKEQKRKAVSYIIMFPIFIRKIPIFFNILICLFLVDYTAIFFELIF